MKLLDHGEVNIIETWGSDENVIRAARQSTDGAFRSWDRWKCDSCGGEFDGEQPPILGCTICQGNKFKDIGDKKLLKYLYTHKHMSPFEMAGATFEVKAPIFVFREWHRHRTQSYNEMSARYIPIPDEHYLPTEDRLGLNIGKTENRQAMGLFQGDLLQRFGPQWLERVKALYETAQDVYQEGLNIGVPKEIARIVMPVGRYSKMWASANLRNWLQFLSLRNDSAAQWEIRQYAIAVQTLLKERFPRTLALFEEGR